MPVILKVKSIFWPGQEPKETEKNADFEVDNIQEKNENNKQDLTVTPEDKKSS